MKGTEKSKRFRKLLTLAPLVTLLVVFGLSHMTHAALVAHWTFDVAGVDPTADVTGNGNDGILGTVVGADSADPTYECTPANIAPIAGNVCSLRFDGTNDRVVVMDDPLLNPSGSITIALWFKTTDTNGGMFINKDGVTAARQYDIHINADLGLATNFWSPSRAVVNTKGVPNSSLINYNDSNWHHVISIFDASDGKVRLYVDGILVGTSLETITGVQATTQNLFFGFRPNEPLPFNGLIDDVRIYNEALQPPSVTLWQIGMFDNSQTEFLSGNLDTSFVCDSLVPGGSGTVGDFIVGVTQTDKFPGVIRSSNASTSDARYTKSCNSTTIRFEVPEGISYIDVALRYNRMGGEKDAIYFDGTFVGFAGPLSVDPHPAVAYFFSLGIIDAGTHTIRIVGQERPPCSGGANCIAGKADGYHFVDALRLTGNLFVVGVSQPPTADAGPNELVNLGTLVTLDGSGSSDPDGDYPLSYTWEITSKPAESTATLGMNNTVNPSFTPDLSGDYIISLVVTDAKGLPSTPAQVTIIVNFEPVANAGPDQTVRPGTTVNLDGSGSSDLDGHTPLQFAWTFAQKPSGSTATLTGADTTMPCFTADVAGSYTIRLVVTDTQGATSAPDEVVVSTVNTKPVPDAGSDQAVRLRGTTIQLDGGQSYDPDGDIPLTFAWTLLQKPATSTASLSNATSSTPTFVADIPGGTTLSSSWCGTASAP